jgi:catechol 2,3-dioxygenase-like lactoylglutathione lyase family enzyme
MQIKLTSVMVEDQDQALKFYTEILGFVKKQDFPVGDYKFLTVVSPEMPAEVELLLEPLGHPAAKAFQQAMFDSGIPLAAFAVDDIHSEYARLTQLGVVFNTKPTQSGPTTFAIFEDTCGNRIQIYQVK